MHSRLVGLGLGVVLSCTAGLAGAQTCRKALANVENAGQPFTISTTASTVLRANTSRCSALIHNNSAADLVCRDAADGAPTTTAGTLIPAGRSLSLGAESQGQWQCIRSGVADATVYVTEGRP